MAVGDCISIIDGTDAWTRQQSAGDAEMITFCFGSHNLDPGLYNGSTLVTFQASPANSRASGLSRGPKGGLISTNSVYFKRGDTGGNTYISGVQIDD